MSEERECVCVYEKERGEGVYKHIRECATVLRSIYACASVGVCVYDCVHLEGYRREHVYSRKEFRKYSRVEYSKYSTAQYTGTYEFL